MQIHSLAHSQPYDHVLYGASVAGVLLALHHAAAGASVLLLNPYGFPGGSVTESLSCLQAWPETRSPHAQQLFAQLAADRYATVYDGPEGRVLNPEVVKIALQHALEASPVHLLFHVKARGLDLDADGLRTLRLVGKEGEFRVRARNVLDASDAHHLARTVHGSAAPLAARLCLFTSPASAAAAAVITAFPQLQQALRLPDGRYWLTLDLPTTEPAFVEHQANDVMDALTAALTPLGARLQIVPAETQLLYASTPAPGLRTVAELLPDRQYQPHQWLQRAADAEAAAAHVLAPTAP